MKAPKKIVIIGSGIGGLVSGLILCKHGYEVDILEKNHQIGGSLQVFSRDKHVFDTGVHYVGGLDPGENLAQLFSYLGIYEDLKMRRLDEDGFDIIRLANGKEVKHGMGYPAFKKQLKVAFPENEQDIETICESIQKYCTFFPLYNLEADSEINYVNHPELLELGAWEHLAELTDNENLIQSILGSGPLYAGKKGVTPFYVVALILNSFIKGSYRFVDGGSQIAKLLMREIRKYGGKIHRRKEVVSATLNEQGLIQSVHCSDGSMYSCDFLISNTHPAETIRIVGENHFKPAFRNRIQGVENTTASFMVYLSFHENSFPYTNANYYDYFTERIWEEEFTYHDAWPQVIFTSFQVGKHTSKYAESASVMCYMDYEQFKAWEDSHKTVVHPSERSSAYEAMKRRCEEQVVKRLEERFPEITKHIKAIYSSSPITYRDYIATPRGSMYGIQKDKNHPLRTQINSRTHIPNLFLTGQNIIFHGILGATIGAFVTSFHFVDKIQLIQELKKKSK